MQCPLNGCCGCHRISGPREDGEPAISFSSGSNDDAIVLLDQALDELVVTGQGYPHLVGMALPQLG